MENIKTIKVGLCQGRHNIPDVQGYVFGQFLAPELLTNSQGLEQAAEGALWDLLTEHDSFCHACGVKVSHDWCEHESPRVGDFKVALYATGLTVALLAAINAIKKLGGQITVMHYDRESGDYFPQEVA